MKKAVVAIVDTRAQAESIVKELAAAGFRASSLSVLLPDQARTTEFAHERHTKAPEGATLGVGAGGVVGGAVGLLAGLGALAIPGLGPFIAAGPLLAALSGAAAGAAVGGVAGALVGMGIPEFEARMYEGHLKSGNFLVAIHTDNIDQQKLAQEIFKRSGAKDVTTQREVAAPHEGRI